jgi:hypothetical protein
LFVKRERMNSSLFGHGAVAADLGDDDLPLDLRDLLARQALLELPLVEAAVVAAQDRGPVGLVRGGGGQHVQHTRCRRRRMRQETTAPLGRRVRAAAEARSADREVRDQCQHPRGRLHDL